MGLISVVMSLPSTKNASRMPGSFLTPVYAPPSNFQSLRSLSLTVAASGTGTVTDAASDATSA